MLLSLVFISSCDKEDDDPIPTEETGNVSINFDYVWGMNNSAFAMNTNLTHPMTGEELNFSTLKFYISNIKLKSEEDGSWWMDEDSYYLIDASVSGGSTITLEGLPVAHYTDLSYVIGVDSARNVSGAQTGALSVANSMFWSWNSGYIMIKAEGEETTAGSFAYHLGGFSGANNVVTEKTTDFNGSHLMVMKDQTSNVNISVNPARFWHSTAGVAALNDVHMPGANAVTLAGDFTDGFNFTGF